jgi:phosphoserine phosphatase
MSEWWQKHFELMIECGLTKTDVESITEKSHLELRPKVAETLQLLNEHNIPVVIISASAIGEAVPLFLTKNQCNFPNISFVCNRFIWDEKGIARDV